MDMNFVDTFSTFLEANSRAREIATSDQTVTMVKQDALGNWCVYEKSVEYQCEDEGLVSEIQLFDDAYDAEGTYIEPPEDHSCYEIDELQF